MDIAAEVVVCPLTLYVKLRELKDEFDASIVGERTNEKISATKENVNRRAREVSDKVSETEVVKRAKSAYENARENAEEVRGKVNEIFGKGGEEEEEIIVEVEIIPEEEAAEESCAAEGAETEEEPAEEICEDEESEAEAEKPETEE